MRDRDLRSGRLREGVLHWCLRLLSSRRCCCRWLSLLVRLPRRQVTHALVEEIQNNNQQLINTIIEISGKDVDPSALTAAMEGGEGITVKCSFTTIALSP